MLPSIILGGFSVSYGNANDSHDDPGRFVGPGGGWGDRETTGNPNPLARVRTGVA